MAILGQKEFAEIFFSRAIGDLLNGELWRHNWFRFENFLLLSKKLVLLLLMRLIFAIYCLNSFKLRGFVN